MDYARPFKGTYLLIIVDAYSKWLEVYPINTITSKTTIECLRECFARFGLPVVLVSDNGPSLVSIEFERFLKGNGIKHVTNAPYYPSSNGQAERYVQTVKVGLRKVDKEPGSLQTKLTNFLMHYRQAPHSATNESPAQLMYKRNFRTKLDLMTPNVVNKMHIYNEKMYIRNKSQDQEIEIGERVQFRVYHNKNEKWQVGVVRERRGTCMYIIESVGKLFKRHINQIIKYTLGEESNAKSSDMDMYDTYI